MARGRLAETNARRRARHVTLTEQRTKHDEQIQIDGGEGSVVRPALLRGVVENMHHMHDYSADLALDASRGTPQECWQPKEVIVMYVITGATGHTGSGAAEQLLAAGKQLRVFVRDAKKAEGLRARGVEVFVGDFSDQEAFARAVRGAEGVYLLSPPDLGARDLIHERKELTGWLVATLTAEKVPHVVLLSSVGAHQPAGTGPILTAHNAEQQLRASGLSATFVRAGYFVENWGAVVGAVKSDGVLPSFIPADRAVPSVSTVDIGKTIAQALLDGPRGVRVLELGGPTDVTPNDVAAAFSRILGKPVSVVEAPLDAVVPTFTSFGASENLAGLYREMYEGIASGVVAPESGGEHVRGTTPIEAVLRGLLG